MAAQRSPVPHPQHALGTSGGDSWARPRPKTQEPRPPAGGQPDIFPAPAFFRRLYLDTRQKGAPGAAYSADQPKLAVLLGVVTKGACWAATGPARPSDFPRHQRQVGHRIRQRHGIHGNGYVSSRVALVWVSMDEGLIKAATERMVSSTEVPRWRIFDSGHRNRGERRT